MGGTGFASVPRRRNSRKRVFRGLEALVALLTVLFSPQRLSVRMTT